MFVARAPGKVVALGEYAVLDGAPAVVLGARPLRRGGDRPEPGRRLSPHHACRRASSSGGSRRASRAARRSIDLVTAAVEPPLAWVATIDSQALVRGLEQARLGVERRRAVRLGGRVRRLRAQPRRPRRRNRKSPSSSLCTGSSRAARAAVSTSRRRSRAGRLAFSLATIRSAPNWFSPPAEQCRIRGYFCRPVCLYARVGCALPGVAPQRGRGRRRRS